MKVSLIWVGKTREAFILEGIGKYIRLLQMYADVNTTEIKEEKGKDIQKMLRKEGDRISKLKKPFILLDEKGRELTSVQFAKFIENSNTPINFLLGGAFGVADDIKEKALDRIALSPMTLTHEMARLVLVEQIYRAFTIIQKRGYHH